MQDEGVGRRSLSGGRGGQALLPQTHGQFTTRNTHFRGQRNGQAIHTKPGGIVTKLSSL